MRSCAIWEEVKLSPIHWENVTPHPFSLCYQYQKQLNFYVCGNQTYESFCLRFHQDPQFFFNPYLTHCCCCHFMMMMVQDAKDGEKFDINEGHLELHRRLYRAIFWLPTNSFRSCFLLAKTICPLTAWCLAEASTSWVDHFCRIFVLVFASTLLLLQAKMFALPQVDDEKRKILDKHFDIFLQVIQWLLSR